MALQGNDAAAEDRKHQEDQERSTQSHNSALFQSPYYGTFSLPAGSPFPHKQQLHKKQSQHHFCIPVISEDRPLYSPYFLQEEPLPFWNIGVGWLLFAIGFLLILPWFVGAFIFACLRHDNRENAGLAACTIAAFVALLAGGSRLM